MNGNNPVRLWYTMPLFLSANAPKQNTLAMDSLLLSTMMLGLNWARYAGPGYTGTSWISGKTRGTIWATGSNGTLSVVGPFGCVLQMLCLGCFMWPLPVAGLGLRYLSINVSIKFGHPLTKPLRTALRRVKILRLHSNWWAN